MLKSYKWMDGISECTFANNHLYSLKWLLLVNQSRLFFSIVRSQCALFSSPFSLLLLRLCFLFIVDCSDMLVQYSFMLKQFPTYRTL